MALIIDQLSKYFKIVEVRAQDEKNESNSSGTWSRRVSISMCDDEPPRSPPPQNQCQQCQEEEEYECDECRPQCESFLGKKLKCLFRGARRGLREGALMGVFFGGSFGIFRHVDKTYIHPDGGDGGGGDNDEEGDRAWSKMDSIIFVSALNSAIAFGVICTLFCASKAVIYCN